MLGEPTESAIHDLARGVVAIQDRILAFYDDPEHEEAFQRFLAAGGIQALIQKEKGEQAG